MSDDRVAALAANREADHRIAHHAARIARMLHRVRDPETWMGTACAACRERGAEKAGLCVGCYFRRRRGTLGKPRRRGARRMPGSPCRGCGTGRINGYGHCLRCKAAQEKKRRARAAAGAERRTT